MACACVLGLTATCVLLLAACSRTRGQSAAVDAPPTAVVVETAEHRDGSVVVELPARTEAAATIEIRANVEGRLTEMSFLEGRIVKKGQLLFRIDPRRYDSAVQSARATVEKAEADLEMAQEQQRVVNAQSALRQAEANHLKADQDAERLKPLAARRAVPQRDMDAAIAAQSSARAAVEDARATLRTTAVGDRMGLRQAHASLAAARAALDTAQLDREATEIHAAMGGLIGRSEVSVGNHVGRGEPSRLATISQLDPINVGFSISEELYLYTRSKGLDKAALDRIELILSDNTAYPYRGRFPSLGRAIDEKTGMLPVIAQFPNSSGVLLPGMLGRVRVVQPIRPDAVLVSELALFDDQGSKAVYVVGADERVTLRRVGTEGRFQGSSVITKGLRGGERVIIEGIAKVRPGQTVSAQTSGLSRGK